MATQSPFLLFESFARGLGSRLQAPAWAVDEAQRRITLLLNHVLVQEPAATERLVRQKGSVVLVQWQSFRMRFLVTPAGLLDLAPAESAPDLSLTLTDESASAIAQAMLRGGKPALRVEGDVQLAAEVNWLVDHVRWDIEEDLARVVGDAPAHALGQLAQRMAHSVRQFAGADKASTGVDGAAP